MGCAQSRLRTRVDVRDLEAFVRTGDIILFSSKHAAAVVTKCFTASTWDHIGLVVKFGPHHVYVLEYAGGVFLYPLFTRLYTYFAIQGREIHLRRLLPGQDRLQMQQRVEAFVRNVLGQKPPSIEEMLVAVLKQEQLLSSFISRLAGGSDTSKEVEDDLETLFCSKLIAAVYKDIGVLGKHRSSSDFLPKHFSSPYDGCERRHTYMMQYPIADPTAQPTPPALPRMAAGVNPARHFRPRGKGEPRPSRVDRGQLLLTGGGEGEGREQEEHARTHCP